MKIRDRIKEIRSVKASDLLPNPHNWRTHPEEQKNAMMGAFAEIGNIDVLKVIETEAGLMLVDGHLRDEIFGDQVVRVAVLDLTQDEAKKALATFDPIAIAAEADQEKLAALLAEIELESAALDELLTEHIDEALPDQPTDGLTDDDELPEDVETITQPGDLWTLGEHKLLCGDSTSKEYLARLMDGQKVDMLFTDPPYGVDYEGGHFHSGDVNIKRKREKLANDDQPDIYKTFLPVVLPYVDGPCYVFFAGSQALTIYQAVTDNKCEISALLIWHKTNATYAAMNAQYKQRHEPFLYFKPKKSKLRWIGATTESTIWELKRDPKNEFHPTQKPVELATRALMNHDAATVLDCFAGSGSTLIAAQKCKRTFYGIEMSPNYCDVIVKRWEAFTGLKAGRQCPTK